MCHQMEEIHSAENDTISTSTFNLRGFDVTGADVHTQNVVFNFLWQDPLSNIHEAPPNHAVSNCHDTCWVPAIKHSNNMSGDTDLGFDVTRRMDGIITQNEGFVPGGTNAMATQKQLLSRYPVSRNVSSPFLGADADLGVVVAGNNELVGSSSSLKESEVNPRTNWLKQSCELNCLNSANTDLMLQIEKSALNYIGKQQRQNGEEHGRIYLGNVQRGSGTSVPVKEEAKFGGATDAQNCALLRNGVTNVPPIGSRLAKRAYFDGGGEGGTSREEATSVMLPVFIDPCAVKKHRTVPPALHIRCQVEGCKTDLSSSAKDYHRKHKVCEMHSKAAKVIANGMEQRFCQQCSRFHVLGEFDESKRSCRRRLASHNERRRKFAISQDHMSATERFSSTKHGLAMTCVPDGVNSRAGSWRTYDKQIDEEILDRAISSSRHATERSPTLLQAQQGLKSNSSYLPEMTHHRFFMQAPTCLAQGFTPPATGTGIHINSLTSSRLSAAFGRALSLLSPQVLASKANVENLMGGNHISVSHELATTGVIDGASTLQFGLVACREENLVGLSPATMQDHEPDHVCGNPTLAHCATEARYDKL